LIISRHGCPEKVISNQVTQFTSYAFKKMCDTFNITALKSSAYHHHRCNGKVERFIRFLKQALAIVTPEKHRNKWDELLNHCLFVY
jgi:hypothetical protein